MYEGELTKKSLSDQVAFWWSVQWIHLTNLKISKHCIKKKINLMWNLQSHGFLLKWLDIAHEILQSKCNYTN